MTPTSPREAEVFRPTGEVVQLREPTPVFTVDREHGVVTWEANGLRLVRAPQFRALSDLFLDNGWKRHFNALHDAELAVSEVVVRRMLRACPEAHPIPLLPRR